MSEIETGGPAFPCEQHETLDGSWNQTFDPGMTLRDWFAGQALHAIIGLAASPDFQSKSGSPMTELDFAESSYHFADAMLTARAAKGARDAQ